MQQETIDSKIYIIKSAQNVLGPYSIKEIIDQMWARKLHAFDEVKTPFTRWSFLRDDEVLGKVFKDIIEDRASSDDANDVTTTLEKTAFTISEKLQRIKEQTMQTASVVEADVDFHTYQENVEDITSPTSSVRVITSRASYKKHRKAKFRAVYLILLVASIAVFGSLLLEERKEGISVSVNSSLWDKSVYLGDYATILSGYDPKRQYNLDSSYKFIEAYISMDKFIEAEKIIMTMSSDVLPAKEKAKLINYLGVIELHRQNFDLANQKFKDALHLDPNLEEAQINLVDGLLLIDNIQEAKAYLPTDVKLENAQSTAVYLHFETLFFDEKFLPEDDLWMQEVFSQTAQPYDQKQEILILLGLLLLEKGFVVEGNQILQRSLDVDPDYLQQNIHAQSLYHPKVVIQKTLVFLKRYEFKYQDNPYYAAAIAMLYHKAKSPILSKKYLDQALRLNPNDPSLLAMRYLLEPNYNETQIIEKILSGQLMPLEAKLAANYCLQLKNWKCADEIWNYILMADPNSVEAITGKVNLFIHKNLLQEAKHWLYRGLGIAPRYIPLRKIEMEANL